GRVLCDLLTEHAPGLTLPEQGEGVRALPSLVLLPASRTAPGVSGPGAPALPGRDLSGAGHEMNGGLIDVGVAPDLSYEVLRRRRDDPNMPGVFDALGLLLHIPPGSSEMPGELPA